MKRQKTKLGFTLIELMVVIAIIGVLAVALVPQLGGAQARSRDASRMSNVKNVTAVLETYFSDEGQYPTAPSASDDAGCFSSADGVVDTDVGDLLKSGKAPQDPQKSSKSGACGVDQQLGYHPLDRDGLSNNAFILITNVETVKKANFDRATNAVADASDFEDASDALDNLPADLSSLDQDASVYVDIN